MTPERNRRMMESYIVIKCGHEGIEKLLYHTGSSQDAVNKVMELRKHISEAKEHRKQVYEASGIVPDEDGYYIDDPWAKQLEDKLITSEEYFDAQYGEPDSYCVQKWDGKIFSCACKDLGCEPSEGWLM